ncbi:D-alanyl-D-alanine carboxypeptidase family protein [Paenibacillus aurantius]|uniref:serine-type D-Ala-D-Ala carboxypeptidase n=1 Tax=Paenibacillus aurantius TaxID=2918900 RepID=A0AA96RFJ0_9BACL|nr:D-alanyl-D-alanine carboxypeptidase family protein [Paenibacillus aurantius]WNQ11516.1 D-alanyl-D-alanine carboxypeptidase family protein [Paenibacillus aurantius]
MGKRVALGLTAVLLGSLLMPVLGTKTVQAAEAADLKLNVKSAILMDAGTGQILYDNNSDVAYPPASMAKMMTEYLVMENIQSGKFKWTDMVTTSQYASDVIGSGQLLALNEQMTMKDMFSQLSIYSANDAAVALAEKIGGSEENFAKMMNAKAKELGLSDKAHFINSTGLGRADIGKYAPASIEGETMLTAKDAAKLAYAIIRDHKEVLDFTKITSQKLRPTDKEPMVNWNWMLEGNKDNVYLKQYAYPGLDGLKTGHTDEAGYCFTGTAERNGMRLISVVMGAPDEPKRFTETAKLLNYGFDNFEAKNVIAASTAVDSLKTVPITKGVSLTVPAVTEKALTVVAKKGAKPEEFVQEAKAIDASKLVAPIKKGTEVGTLNVTYNNQTSTVKLVAAEDVEKGSWIRLMFRGIKDFFGGLFSGVKNLF